MTKQNDDLRKSEAVAGEKENRFWGPCKYCPLSRISCPMSRVFMNFQR
jgi:hypothetical protein